jgi:hypothetical protein
MLDEAASSHQQREQNSCDCESDPSRDAIHLHCSKPQHQYQWARIDQRVSNHLYRGRAVLVGEFLKPWLCTGEPHRLMLFCRLFRWHYLEGQNSDLISSLAASSSGEA